MNTKEYFYLSDEELMHLIDLSETDGLLPAPKQLKSAILTAAARAPRPLTRAEKRNTRYYVFKVFRAKFAHELFHARRFKLEHRRGFP